MPKMINLVGQKFERLVVIKRVENNKWGSSRWLCLCDCDNETIIQGGDLRSGAAKSCGCLRKEKLMKRLTKHGHRTTSKTTATYVSWRAMNQRCTDPNGRQWKDYGGRGITVCEEWGKFTNFLEDMGERPNDKSIERINNNKGYCKSNCR